MTDDTRDNDNVVYLSGNKTVTFEKHPVPDVCELAGKTLQDVVILGEAEDGSIKMMTTQSSVPDILFYLETAKLAILTDDGTHQE